MIHDWRDVSVIVICNWAISLIRLIRFIWLISPIRLIGLISPIWLISLIGPISIMPLLNLVDVIRCFLVNVVVYPVIEEEVGMRAPCHYGRIVRIVVLVIVHGHVYVVALAHVALVFVAERVGRILKMAGDEELRARRAPSLCPRRSRATRPRASTPY